jgi:hypothetical protein
MTYALDERQQQALRLLQPQLAPSAAPPPHGAPASYMHPPTLPLSAPLHIGAAIPSSYITQPAPAPPSHLVAASQHRLQYAAPPPAQVIFRDQNRSRGWYSPTFLLIYVGFSY